VHEVSYRLHALGHKLATDSAEGGLVPQHIQWAWLVKIGKPQTFMGVSARR
jgi:hypothetical protein